MTAFAPSRYSYGIHLNPDRPCLRKGDSGEDVKYLASKMTPWRKPLTGDFNDVIEKAVKDFQKDKNLDPDGVVGPDTWAALGERGAPCGGGFSMSSFLPSLPSLTPSTVDTPSSTKEEGLKFYQQPWFPVVIATGAIFTIGLIYLAVSD